MQKKTTVQLVSELIEVEQELLLEKDINRTEELAKLKNNLQIQVKTKIENVDHFMLELNKKEHIIDAEVEALKDEIDRLKNKRKGLERTKDFFHKKLLPAVIEEVGNDGVYETNVARYKLYQTFGPVDIDPHTIHSDFKKVEIVEKIDKSKARKAAIAAFNAGQEMPPGIDISKVKRVKRT